MTCPSVYIRLNCHGGLYMYIFLSVDEIVHHSVVRQVDGIKVP